MKSEIYEYPSGIEWVWLDLDDTLVDFRTNSRAALRLLYEQEGLESYYPTPEEWITAYETHNHSLWDRYSRAEISQDFLRVDRFATPLAPGFTGSRKSLEEYSRWLDPVYLDLLAEQRTLVDGALELLGLLRTRGYNIGVLSNGFTDVQNRKLRNCGLADKVDLMVLSDDIGVNKPDVRLFNHAMNRSGQDVAGKHMMVGDNASTDILGAVRAGWRPIHLDISSDTLKMAGEVLVTPSLRCILSLKW